MSLAGLLHRASMGGKAKPYDAEIEYLESNGTQFIEIPFGFDKTDEIEMRFALLQTNPDKFIVCPKVWNNSNNRFGLGGGNRFSVGYGSANTGQTILQPVISEDMQIHSWSYKDYKFEVMDLYRNPSLDVSNITFGSTTANLKLFYGYNTNTSGRVAYYKQVKNGVKVIELIPVRIGQVGYLYDKVSGTLYGNNGSGNFILGSDK